MMDRDRKEETNGRMCQYRSIAERLNQIRDRIPGDGGIKHKQPAGKWDVVSRIQSLTEPLSPLKHPPSSRSGCYNLLLLKPPPPPHPRPLHTLSPLCGPPSTSPFSFLRHATRLQISQGRGKVQRYYRVSVFFFSKYMRSIHRRMFLPFNSPSSRSTLRCSYW